ncbi:MAG: hypothetical protein H7A33_04235 [Deltaproteobacteria bacterium]|nr:hypothetical protein [Deltaproteobacteria bacterium]
MKLKKQSLVIVLLAFFSLPVLAQAPDTTAAKTNDKGIILQDPNRGITIEAPNASWGVNAGKYTISLNHVSFFDAHVTLKKSWYSVTTAQEAYEKRKASLKSYMPGAVFLKENEKLSIGDNVAAMSMIYKNPSDLKVLREIVFVHRGQPYELVFQAKDENFQKVKEEFGFILENLKLF